jgi:DNA-binding response OmpR family regulator
MIKRILIVDDEGHIRRMIRLALETAGYEVGEAADGQQALEMLPAGSEWDVVLLDQKMPGMDGLDVLRELNKRGLEMPVIMITAFASIELAVEAMKLGASDFVRKPMTPEILRDAVTAALAKARRPRQPATVADQDVSKEEPVPLIHTITMNGFEIVRPTETEATNDSEPVEPRERRFIVKNPRGWQREVIVEIPDEVVAYAERITRRQLPPGNSFWTARAERALATYLWNEGCFPDQRLTVSDLRPEELDVAARWELDE